MGGEDAIDEKRRPVSFRLSAARKHQLNGFSNDYRVIARVVFQQPHEGDGQLVGAHGSKPPGVKIITLGPVLNETSEICLEHGMRKRDESMQGVHNSPRLCWVCFRILL